MSRIEQRLSPERHALREAYRRMPGPDGIERHVDSQTGGMPGVRGLLKEILRNQRLIMERLEKLKD